MGLGVQLGNRSHIRTALSASATISSTASRRASFCSRSREARC